MNDFQFPNCLYLITSPSHARDGDVTLQVKAMLRAGARLIQYRDKDLGNAEFETNALKIREVIDEWNERFDEESADSTAGWLSTKVEQQALLVINDRPGIAVRIGADGVHLGQEDMLEYGETMTEAVENVRVMFERTERQNPKSRSQIIVGVSTHSYQQAMETAAAGVDYIGVGPIYQTPTKPGRPGIGLEEVKKIIGDVQLPKVGIGGLNRANYQEVLELGVEAVAMVRAVCDPLGTGIGEDQEVEKFIKTILTK